MSAPRSSSLKIDQGGLAQTSRPSSQEIMSAVATFRSAVIRIRDILRSCAITGMDSMRHICLYLLSRYITRERAVALGVPDKLCWEAFMELIRHVEGGKEFALDRFHHLGTEEETLVKSFDRLFGTEDFPFSMKNMTKHAEILEILDKVDMSHVDCEMDILGWVYEQHLKTGSSAARDLGQYFTDRFICEYMTALCAPRLTLDGVPESVCDPSMGTGGFLTEYVKYLNRAYPGQVNWSVHRDKIHGCDTDSKVAGVARLNLFMELGGHRVENLLTHDSLQGDLSLTGYDMILANMPFGLKGLKHADCCERVRDLKIRGTKSEPLFLQLMMVSLNRGGRCAVVVPDGMLVNQSGCHDGTRKYLLENFELRKVIKMTGKFFMNTGIQPSILFFENTGHPTKAVEFWNVVRGERDAVEETLVATVMREQIMADATCSLDVRRYLEAEKPKANGTGWPMVKLGELFEVASIKHRYTNKDSGANGIPFYNGCYNSPTTYIDTKHPSYSSLTEYIVIIKDGGGDHSSPTVGLGKSFIASGDVCIASQNAVLVPKTKDNSLKYIHYVLSLQVKELRDLSKKSINLEHLSIQSILDFSIPLPPLPIQHEIVATLDRIYSPGTTDLADTLRLTTRAMDLVLADPTGATLEPVVEAQRLARKSAQMVADVKAQMVADVKAQMVAVVKSVERRGFPVITLKEICQVSFGGRITQKEHTGTIYPVYGSGGDTFRTDNYNRTERTCKVGRFALSEPNMVMIVNGPYWLMDSGFTVESKQKDIMTTEYLWYCLLMDKKKLATLSTGSCQKNIVMDEFYKVEYPLPPLPFQESLVARLDALQTQLGALLALQRQSEDNARFILESYIDFPSKTPSPSEAEPEVRMIHDDAKEEMEEGVVYVDPETVVEMASSEDDGHAAEASSSTTVAPAKKTRRPKMAKKE